MHFCPGRIPPFGRGTFSGARLLRPPRRNPFAQLDIEMAAQDFVLLEMDVLQRAALQADLPALDHPAIFGMNIADHPQHIFAGETL